MYTVKDILPSCDTTSVDTEEENDDFLYIKYEIEKCIKWLQDHMANRICLQFSKYDLRISPRIVKILESNIDKKFFILGDTSYGSCCVDEVAARHVNADAIIHFGHSCLSPVDSVPVLYIFNKNRINVNDFICCFRKTFQSNDKVLLLYNVSYSHAVEDIAKILHETYDKLVISELCSNTDKASVHQFLGRCFSLPENLKLSDYHVAFIGEDGPTVANFKYLTSYVSFHIYNPTVPGIMEPYNINISLFLRRRMFLIESIKSMKSLGILIGTLSVKSYLKTVERIKQLAKSNGIRCYIISVGKISVTKLANFPEIDGYVLISCSENTLLDSKEYLQPIVTPYEVEIALGGVSWSESFITDFTALESCAERHEDGSSFETETNVSLITGRVRSVNEPNEPVDESTALMRKAEGSVVVSGSFGSGALAARTWAGLQPKLGQTEVKAAVPGRKGIPYKYENETS